MEGLCVLPVATAPRPCPLERRLVTARLKMWPRTAPVHVALAHDNGGVVRDIRWGASRVEERHGWRPAARPNGGPVASLLTIAATTTMPVAAGLYLCPWSSPSSGGVVRSREEGSLLRARIRLAKLPLGDGGGICTPKAQLPNCSFISKGHGRTRRSVLVPFQHGSISPTSAPRERLPRSDASFRMPQAHHRSYEVRSNRHAQRFDNLSRYLS